MYKSLCTIMLWSVIFATHAQTTVTEFLGNDNNSADFDAALTTAGYEFYGKYDVDEKLYTGSVFTLTGGTQSGTWASNVAIAGLVIKTANNFLFVNFGSDNTQTSGDWCTDTPCSFDGVAASSFLGGKDLSHLSLYTAIAPVPEASTYALMLSGLGLVGFMVRRKKNKQV